jgi:hypothetical protein
MAGERRNLKPVRSPWGQEECVLDAFGIRMDLWPFMHHSKCRPEFRDSGGVTTCHFMTPEPGGGHRLGPGLRRG